jgi:O-antigen/teichoic acid export membrane protein
VSIAARPETGTTPVVTGFGLVWRGAAARGTATIVAKGAAFLVTLVLVRTLPAAQAGSFFLALAAASTAGPLLSLGTAEMVARHVPTADAGGSLVDGASVARSAIRIVGRIAIVAVLLTSSVAFIVDRSLVAWAVVVAAMASLLAVESIGAAFLRARRRAVLAETLQASAPTVFLVAVFAFAHPSSEAQALFGVRAALELAVCVVLLFVLARMTREHTASWDARRLVRAASPFWISGLAWLALQNVDVLILGMSHGAAAVGGYVPILRIADVTATILGLFAAYLLPIAAGMHASGRTEEIHDVYVRTTALGVALSVPVLSILAVAPDALIELLFPATPSGAVVVARIFAIAYTVNAMFFLSTAVLLALGDARALARRWVIVLVATIAVDAVLVPALGMVGAALGTCAGLVMLNGASAGLLSKRHGMSALSRVVVVPVVAAIAVAAILATAVPAGRWALAAVALGSGGTAVAATWWFGRRA